MNDTLLRSWWLLALRGAVTLMFGAAAILWPAMTLVTLAALFAAFALVAGAVSVWSAVRQRSVDRRWWLLLLLGASSLAAGMVAASHPELTTMALGLLVGAHALVSGILEVTLALRMRQRIRGESLLLASGIVSVGFGVTVLMFPSGAGALALAWSIGLYATVSGAMLLALSLRMCSWSRQQRRNRASPPIAVSPGSVDESAGGLP